MEANERSGLLDRIAAEASGGALPPVESWNPPYCGMIDIEIAADGQWFHEGEPIRRERLVRLFSTILRRDPDGSFVLVTPVEKLGIKVVDAPFLAVELSVLEGRGPVQLCFLTNLGDRVVAGPANPLRFEGGDDAFRPYVRVRSGLDARLTRAVALDLAERLEERGGTIGIRSGECFFPVSEPESLPHV